MSFTEGKTGFEGRMTPQQQTALTELKAKLEKSEYATDILSHPDQDRWILRFLRATMKDKNGARLFQVDAAEDRILKTAEWRKRMGADDMMRAIEAGDFVSQRPKHWDMFIKQFPYLLVANKENGEHYRFDRFASSMSHADIGTMPVEEWQKCIHWTMEIYMNSMRLTAKALGKEISYYTTVVDCSQISLTGVIARRKFVQLMSDTGAEYYPEMLGKTFLVKCPWYFDKIWSMVKPFIDKDTLNKLIVASSFPMEDIVKIIPPEYLIKEYGGLYDKEELAIPKFD